MAEKQHPKIELPAQEELRRLSKYAQVAYAARCALRVLPLVKEPAASAVVLEKVLYVSSLYSTEMLTSDNLFGKIADAAYNAAAPAARATAPAARATAAATAAATTITNAYAATGAAYNAARAATANSGFSLNEQEIIHEIRSDFDDLEKEYSGNERPVNIEFYSKPLWAHLDQDGVSRIEKEVSDWEQRIQSESETTVHSRYWHFFDSSRFGDIPWKDIEPEVQEWLAELETEEENESPTKPGLNADGAPSSLGAGLSDTDLLGRQTLVDSVAAMIASPNQETPFTIGLLGDWGSGKSNVMHLLRKELEKRMDSGRFSFADFNAWQYEHTDNMAAGVAQEVLKAFFEVRENRKRNESGQDTEHSGKNKQNHQTPSPPRFKTYRDDVVKNWKRFTWKTKIRLKFGIRENGWLIPVFMMFLLIFGVISLVMVLRDGSGEWIAALVLTALILSRFVKQLFTIIEHPLTTQINSYLKLPSYADHLGTIPMLKRHLQILCDLIIPPDEENPNRLIVFVDDLDRCEPEAISRTLDAIRLVMDIENVVVIIGIDHRIAFRAVEKQYVDLADDERTSSDIARDYLGKIIQLPVMLNKPDDSDLENFISGVLFREVKDEPEGKEDEERKPVRDWKGANGDDKSGREKSGDDIQEEEAGSQNDSGAAYKDGDDPETSVDERGKKGADRLPPVMEMTETADEKNFFTEMCKRFGMHNPRQLIRLRNCYRLLKRMYQPGEEQWRPKMAMLFWLEFLYAQEQDDRARIILCLNNGSLNGLKECAGTIKNKIFNPEMIDQLEEIFQLSEGFESYRTQERLVSRMVLPHSESPEKAKQESEVVQVDAVKEKREDDEKHHKKKSG